VSIYRLYCKYKLILEAGIVLSLFSFPWWMPAFYLTLAIRVLFFSILVMSFTFLAGQAGMISLSQAAFFGVSAYAVAITTVRFGIHFPLSVLIGILAAMGLASFFGLFAVRVKGVYFLMITLAFGQIIWGLADQWVSLTGGYNGISGISSPRIGGISFANPRFFYFPLLCVFLACLIFLALIKRSPFGLALRGVRDNPSRMVMLGYPVFLIKYVAFVLSGVIAGISGIFFVYFTGVINPHALGLSQAVWVMLASILGGVESLVGAIIGTLILSAMEVLLGQIIERYMLVIGVAFMLTILFASKGIMGSLQKFIPLRNLINTINKAHK